MWLVTLLIASGCGTQMFVTLNGSDTPSCGVSEDCVSVVCCQTIAYALSKSQTVDELYVQADPLFVYPCESIVLPSNLRVVSGRFPGQPRSLRAVFNCNDTSAFLLNSSVSVSIGAIVLRGRGTVSSISVLLPESQNNISLEFADISFLGTGLTLSSGSPLALDFTQCEFDVPPTVGNSGALLLLSASAYVRIQNTTFASASYSNFGGCLSVTQQQGDLTLLLQNSSFDHCTTELGGGAFGIVVQSPAISNVVVDAVNITNCASTHGGGAIVYVANASFVTSQILFRRVRFVDNFGAWGCGALCYDNKQDHTWAQIEFSECVFERCTTSVGDGGALAVGDSRLLAFNVTLAVVLHDTNFSDCRANDTGHGGALSIYVYTDVTPSMNTTVSVENCTFRNCSAGGVGGALRIDGGADVEIPPAVAKNPSPRDWEWTTHATIRDARFIDCYAGDGGAIAQLSGALVLDQSQFVGNSATYVGGAIFLDLTARMNLNNSLFVNNTASADCDIIDSNGLGGVWISNSTMYAAARPSISSICVSPAVQADFDDSSLLQCAEGSNVAIAPASWKVAVTLVLLESLGVTRRYLIQSYSMSIACVACVRTSYSFEDSSLRGKQPFPIQCLPCPLGAVCNGGPSVSSKLGFWVTRTDDPQPKIAVSTCPAAYCDGTGTDGCSPGRTGVLCGACEQGHTPGWPSRGCVDEATCGSWGAWVGLIFMYSAYAAFFFISSFFDKRGMEIQLGVMFVQLGSNMFSDKEESDTVSQMLSWISGWAQFHVSRSVCLLPHLTAAGGVVMDMLSPFFVAVGLLVLCASYALYSKCCPAAIDPSLQLTAPLMEKSQPSRSPLVGVVSVAVLRLLIFAQSTVISSVLTLLHCIHLQTTSNEFVLFIEGPVECYTGVQIFCWIILLPLAALFPLLLARLSTSSGFPKIRHFLASPWGKKYPWWDTVLLAHVELSALCAVFILDPAPRGVALALLSAAACVIHCLAWPFIAAADNILQLSFLCFLVTLGVFRSGPSIVESLALDSSSLDGWLWGDWVFNPVVSLVLGLPPLLFCACLLISRFYTSFPGCKYYCK